MVVDIVNGFRITIFLSSITEKLFVFFTSMLKFSKIILLTLPHEDLALAVSGGGLGESLRRSASSSSANPQLQFLHALAFLVVAHTSVIKHTKKE